jgi:hypothetical protein
MDIDVNAAFTRLRGRLRQLTGGHDDAQATATVESDSPETGAAQNTEATERRDHTAAQTDTGEDTETATTAGEDGETTTQQSRDAPRSAYSRARSPRGDARDVSTADTESSPNSRRRARAPRGFTVSDQSDSQTDSEPTGSEASDPADADPESEQTTGEARELSIDLSEQDRSAATDD